MHLGRAGLAHHLDDFSAGGAAHDAVVHQYDPFAREHRPVGGMLELDAEVADLVGRLDEGAADIVVTDDPEFEWDAAGLGVTHGGGHAAIGNGDDDIGGNAAFDRELGADALARLIYRHALHHGIRPGEIDIFEDAEAFPQPGERLETADALVVDDDDLARLHVADEVSADDVQRAGLARQHPAAGRAVAGDAAENKGAHAHRIAHAEQRLVGQGDQGIGADDAPQGVDQTVLDGGIERDGDEVDEHLAIGGGLEQAAALDQLAVQRLGVGEVAVMGDRETTEYEIGIKRLDIPQNGVARGGVTIMADRDPAGQRCDDLGVAEIIADQAHAAMGVEARTVISDDPRGLLAPMLQRVQTECGNGSGVGDVPDAEHAAFLMELVVVGVVFVERVYGDVHLQISYSRVKGLLVALPSGMACSRSAAVVSLPRGKSGSFGRYCSGRACCSMAAPSLTKGRARACSTGAGQRSGGIKRPTSI